MVNQKENNEYDDEMFFEEKLPSRAQTAPPRPPNEIDEFKKSQIFLQIEKSLSYLEGFTHPYENQFDIDQVESQLACKNFLKSIEKMHSLLNTKTAERQYRTKFSKAYRILYKENELCYLTEILDSAQEAVPCLFVNGEKYEFSKEVIKKGNILFSTFLELHRVLRKGFLSINYEGSFLNIQNIKNDLREVLEKYDENWIYYEDLYVRELMVIEAKARKMITDAIELDQQLMEIEQKNQEKDLFMFQDTEQMETIKKKLVEQIAKINSVSNVEGHGRDDLSYEILRSAEQILNQISICESESIRNLALDVKKSFQALRELFRKYATNIEVVDPQLRNNQDLIDVLMMYERNWERGKTYFLNKKKIRQLIFISNVLEGLCEKYPVFKQQLEDFDTEVFITIPMILLLRRVNKEDKDICNHYLPELNEVDSQFYSSFEKMLVLVQKLGFSNQSANKENLSKSMNQKPISSRKLSSPFKTLLKSQKTFPKLRKQKSMTNQVYNFIEEMIITQEENHKNVIKRKGFMKKEICIEQILMILRRLSISVQRKNPTEWNEFLNIAVQNSMKN